MYSCENEKVNSWFCQFLENHFLLWHTRTFGQLWDEKQFKEAIISWPDLGPHLALVVCPGWIKSGRQLSTMSLNFGGMTVSPKKNKKPFLQIKKNLSAGKLAVVANPLKV